MKQFYKDHLGFFLLLVVPYVVFMIMLIVPVKYTFDMPGGLSDVDEIISIDSAHKMNGSVSTVYVVGTPKTTMFQLMLASYNEYSSISVLTTAQASSIDAKASQIVGTIQKESSYNFSIIAAYEKLKEDNYDIEFSYSVDTIIYQVTVSDQYKEHNEVSQYDLLGKKLISINGVVDDKLTIDVNEALTKAASVEAGEYATWVLEDDNGKTYSYELYKYENEYGNAVFGITLYNFYRVLSANPGYHIADTSTIGPSGGLMQALYIYASLADDDILQGKKIAGTGTIDVAGNAGAIGGARQKIVAATIEGADVFFVPSGSNYDTVIAAKKEFGLDIEIVSVTSLDDVIAYLRGE